MCGVVTQTGRSEAHKHRSCVTVSVKLQACKSAQSTTLRSRQTRAPQQRAEREAEVDAEQPEQARVREPLARVQRVHAPVPCHRVLVQHAQREHERLVQREQRDRARAVRQQAIERRAQEDGGEPARVERERGRDEGAKERADSVWQARDDLRGRWCVAVTLSRDSAIIARGWVELVKSAHVRVGLAAGTRSRTVDTAQYAQSVRYETASSTQRALKNSTGVMRHAANDTQGCSIACQRALRRRLAERTQKYSTSVMKLGAATATAMSAAAATSAASVSVANGGSHGSRLLPCTRRKSMTHAASVRLYASAGKPK
jgi:hypothetical protein